MCERDQAWKQSVANARAEIQLMAEQAKVSIWLRARLNDAAPSVQPHYRTFIPTAHKRILHMEGERMLRHRYFTPILVALAVFLSSLAAPSLAQRSGEAIDEVQSLRRELQHLRDGQLEILKRLEALQKVVTSGRARRQPAPFKSASISIREAPAKGSPQARIALIEFSDYQCPFCRRFFANTLPRLIKEYVASGKIRYIFRDFPIVRIHPAAPYAAIAARCAGRQGKFWNMHDRFFKNQSSLASRNWRAHATALSLDLAKFDSCMADKEHLGWIGRSIADGRKAGVSGTPTFFLGKISADGKQVNATEMIRGARSYNVFKTVIDRLLARNAE